MAVGAVINFEHGETFTYRESPTPASGAFEWNLVINEAASQCFEIISSNYNINDHETRGDVRQVV